MNKNILIWILDRPWSTSIQVSNVHIFSLDRSGTKALEATQFQVYGGEHRVCHPTEIRYSRRILENVILLDEHRSTFISDELKHTLTHSGSKMLITIPALMPVSRPALDASDCVKVHPI